MEDSVVFGMDIVEAKSNTDIKNHVEEQNLWEITNNDGWRDVSGLTIWRFFHHILLPFNSFHLSKEDLG